MLKKVPKTKLALFATAAITLVATACNHSSIVTAPETTTTQTTENEPVVVVTQSTSSTTTTATVPPETISPEPRLVTTIPTLQPLDAPQVRPTTRYVLTAKKRATNERRSIPVYSSPNGDLITKEKETDLYGQENEQENGQEQVEGECKTLRDFGESCFPTDPTRWGARATFVVTNQDASPTDEWAEVLLSTRPNGQTGWIEAADFEWSTHQHHIIVDLSDKTISVWEGEAPLEGGADKRKLLHHVPVIIGTPSRPTPEAMNTFVSAKIFNNKKTKSEGGYGSAYGSWIFPIALFSDTLEAFDGGTPQVAIHGTNVPEKLGRALSSGCVRVDNDVIDDLAEIIEIGTPVSIIA